MTVIRHAQKSLFVEENGSWVKKDGGPLFDITIGSFESAEFCELSGSYLLDILSTFLGSIKIHLDRADRLTLIQDANGLKQDKLRKDIATLFKKEGLSIWILHFFNL